MATAPPQRDCEQIDMLHIASWAAWAACAPDALNRIGAP